MSSVMIDVREKDEFDAEHVENSISLPLSSFDKQAPAILRTLRGHKVIIMCRSGKRAGLALQQAAAFSDGAELEVFSGGILEWKNQGRATVAAKKAHFPIMRQVQLIAGSLVLAAALLTYFVNPAFVFLAGFMGAGLTFAGATGFCGMAEILARMPWNKSVPGIKKELCEVSSNSCKS